MRTTMVLMVLMVVAGCAATDTGTSAPTGAASDPTADTGVRSGTLGGDPQLEGGCVWLETDTGARVEVRWPDGFQASADPPELRDDSGAIVAREGDRLLVRGMVASEQVSICQVGEIWSATTVEIAD